MSRQYQDPGHHSGHYQSPYPNSSQQHGQFTQLSPPNTQDTYKDHSSQHAYSSYPEGSLRHQPSGQRHSAHSPYARTVHFSEPQGSSTGRPQAHLPFFQTTPNLTGGPHQLGQGRQGSHGYPTLTSTGSSSDNHRFYPEVGSNTSPSSYSDSYSHPEVQSHPGGSYTAPRAHHRGLGTAGYDEGLQDLGLRSRVPGPGDPPASGPRPKCRYPGCYNQVFFDRRVNRLSEWCGEQHMRDAILHHIEKPCRTCQEWPRRKNYKFCGGDVCIYPYYLKV